MAAELDLLCKKISLYLFRIKTTPDPTPTPGYFNLWLVDSGYRIFEQKGSIGLLLAFLYKGTRPKEGRQSTHGPYHSKGKVELELGSQAARHKYLSILPSVPICLSLSLSYLSLSLLLSHLSLCLYLSL